MQPAPYVALHKTEYGTKAYFFHFYYEGKQPPEGQELADLLNEYGYVVEFRPALGDELTAVYCNFPEKKKSPSPELMKAFSVLLGKTNEMG